MDPTYIPHSEFRNLSRRGFGEGGSAIRVPSPGFVSHKYLVHNTLYIWGWSCVLSTGHLDARIIEAVERCYVALARLFHQVSSHEEAGGTCGPKPGLFKLKRWRIRAGEPSSGRTVEGNRTEQL